MGRLRRVFDFNGADLLGVGGYGIALSHNPNDAVKLLYDLDHCKEMMEEARIQARARALLEGIVHVPRISGVFREPVVWQGKSYLCGIAMERVHPPEGFKEPVHILLGHEEDDLDQSWGRTVGKPVSPNNPSRGFFASGPFMEALWEDEGSTWTIERVAYIMGRAFRALVDGGIVPVDLEWIYGEDKQVHLIDFGLCRLGHVDPKTFFFQRGVEGLPSEIYTPRVGDKGYQEFYLGFFGVPVF